MNKLFVPLLLLITTGFVFYYFIELTYAKIDEMKKMRTEYTQALSNVQEVQKKAADLKRTYNGYSKEQIEWVRKMLPDHFDLVDFTSELNRIAQEHGMRIEKVDVKDKDGYGEDEKTTVFKNKIKTGVPVIQEVEASFSVEGSYSDFKAFLNDLETSLRIIDIKTLKLDTSPSEKEAGMYKYNMNVDTYWLNY